MREKLPILIKFIYVNDYEIKRPRPIYGILGKRVKYNLRVSVYLGCCVRVRQVY